MTDHTLLPFLMRWNSLPPQRKLYMIAQLIRNEAMMFHSGASPHVSDVGYFLDAAAQELELIMNKMELSAEGKVFMRKAMFKQPEEPNAS